MKTKMVSHTLETPPALTDAQRDHLAELAALPDETIDTSDIPELSDEAWAAGPRGRFYQPVKQQITARVDADVLDWLKSRVRGSGPAPVYDLQPLPAQLSRGGRSEI